MEGPSNGRGGVVTASARGWQLGRVDRAVSE